MSDDGAQGCLDAVEEQKDGTEPIPSVARLWESVNIVLYGRLTNLPEGEQAPVGTTDTQAAKCCLSTDRFPTSQPGNYGHDHGMTSDTKIREVLVLVLYESVFPNRGHKRLKREPCTYTINLSHKESWAQQHQNPLSIHGGKMAMSVIQRPSLI